MLAVGGTYIKLLCRQEQLWSEASCSQHLQTCLQDLILTLWSGNGASDHEEVIHVVCLSEACMPKNHTFASVSMPPALHSCLQAVMVEQGQTWQADFFVKTACQIILSQAHNGGPVQALVTLRRVCKFAWYRNKNPTHNMSPQMKS